MRRIAVHLEHDQCEALDRLAAVEGSSRSVVIRRIIDSALDLGMRDEDACVEPIREVMQRSPRDHASGVVVDERARHLDALWQLNSGKGPPTT